MVQRQNLAPNLLGDVEDDIGRTLDNLSVGCEIRVIGFLSGAPKLRFDVGIRAEDSLRQQDPKPHPKDE